MGHATDHETDSEMDTAEILDTTGHAKMTPGNANTKAATVTKILGTLASSEDTRWLVTGLSDGGFSSVFLPFTTGVSGSDTIFPPKVICHYTYPSSTAFRMPDTRISSW